MTYQLGLDQSGLVVRENPDLTLKRDDFTGKKTTILEGRGSKKIVLGTR